MWTITGFADEVSPDFAEQLDLMNTLGVKHIEFRSAWQTKILDLTSEQLDEAKSMLKKADVAVSSVGSDLGKIRITDPFDAHRDRAEHAVEVAKSLGAKYVRLFSFFLPEGDDPEQHRDEVMSRTREFVKLAEAGGVTMLHENEKGVYGDVPKRVAELVVTMDSPHYRSLIDPANYVQCGVRPYDEAYPVVGPYTDYVHCKDATGAVVDERGIKKIVPVGQGDGQVRELVSALRSDSYDGFFSIEPHLGDFDAFGGLCGPDLWTTAFNALTGIFREQGIEWR